jgi:Flp pilus assembly pilin Flp
MHFERLPFARFARNRQKGQGLVEYALILLFVAVVVAGTLAPLGAVIAAAFSLAVSDFL